ncbi:MAG: DUF3800 domain-containing protein [Chloroflexota bacterium]
MSTCVIYIDEAGTPYGHHVPLENGETPIFTLAALAFPLWEWRARDRAYLSLKRQFFPDLLGKPDKRDEEFEIKGRDIAAPHNKKSERRQEFNRRVLSFIASNSGIGFGVSFLKNSQHPASHQSIYTQALQILVERFSLFVAEHPAYDNAIVICDSRMKGINGSRQDITVARSHMSYIFGNETGRQFINILEAPLFADSRLTVGLQLVDIFASNLFANQYYYYLRNIEGGIDYSHMQGYWNMINRLQYKSRQSIDGYQVFGYRVVDQRPKEAV